MEPVVNEKIATIATIAPDDNLEPNRDLEKALEGSVSTAQSAVALKLAGASYSDIATTLNYSTPFRARQAVEFALARTVDDDSVDTVRMWTNKRLDRMLRSVFPAATDPKNPDHLGYVKAALAIIDRKAKLNGADAPQVIVHTPATEQVRAWVESMVNQIGGPEQAVQEADIFDAEVVEYDEEMD
jgi:hypothetical protein